MIASAPLATAVAPSRRGAILIPGLPVLAPNVERHPVPGGGTRTLTLDAGDELTVIDREGRSRASSSSSTARGAPIPPSSVHPARLAPRPGSRRLSNAGTRPRNASVKPLRPRPRPRTGFGGAALRRRVAGRRVGDVRGDRPRDAGGGSSGRPDAGGRAVSSDRDRALRAARDPDQREAGGRPPPPLAEPLLDLNIQPGTAGLRGPGGPASSRSSTSRGASAPTSRRSAGAPSTEVSSARSIPPPPAP